MSREDIPNVLIRLTNVTGFAHAQEANLAFKEATEEIERLLAAERERVREMCLQRLAPLRDKADVKYAEASAITGGAFEHGLCVGLESAFDTIRQLDLTAPSTEEGKKI